MSKWIDKDLFEDFRKEKIDEKDSGSGFRSDIIWETPEKGTTENPKVYEGRFLPDPKHGSQKPYQKYYYHMWQGVDENWIKILCPKTGDKANMKNYCPVCSATNKLFKGGSDADKQQGYNIKRKEKFVGNFFIVKDPRDADRDEEKKVEGTVKVYEFPGKVEQKLKKEITDSSEGYGYQIFDPSEEGRNFIIRVLSTKKDERGKQWPDYSNSEFSRTRGAIAETEEDIDAIMDQRQDIDEYISSMSTSNSKIADIMKTEFLWELVEDEAESHGFVSSGSTASKPKPKAKEEPEPKEAPKDDSKKDDSPPWETGEGKDQDSEADDEAKKTAEEQEDDELLKELADI